MNQITLTNEELREKIKELDDELQEMKRKAEEVRNRNRETKKRYRAKQKAYSDSISAARFDRAEERKARRKGFVHYTAGMD